MPKTKPRGKPQPKGWTPDFDLSTIPDHILHAESARRRRRAQLEPPRPRVHRPCEFCLELFGAREIRKHRPVCPKRRQGTETPRPGWILGVANDHSGLQQETYRYWQSRPVGERLGAVWEATEAAYRIRRAE